MVDTGRPHRIADSAECTSVLVAAVVPATLELEADVLYLEDASTELTELLQQFHELGHLPQLIDVCSTEPDHGPPTYRILRWGASHDSLQGGQEVFGVGIK